MRCIHRTRGLGLDGLCTKAEKLLWVPEEVVWCSEEASGWVVGKRARNLR